jgi:antitoxin component HigA of HigAB toxin-antitoxin module
MITGEAEFEAALQEADALLDERPEDGTAEYARLMELLKDLARWRPNVFTPAEPAIADERARLAKHLDTFEAKVKPHYGPHWDSLVGGNFRFK